MLKVKSEKAALLKLSYRTIALPSVDLSKEGHSTVKQQLLPNDAKQMATEWRETNDYRIPAFSHF